jgi:hypothetical protein
MHGKEAMKENEILRSRSIGIDEKKLCVKCADFVSFKLEYSKQFPDIVPPMDYYTHVRCVWRNRVRYTQELEAMKNDILKKTISTPKHLEKTCDELLVGVLNDMKLLHVANTDCKNLIFAANKELASLSLLKDMIPLMRDLISVNGGILDELKRLKK